MKDEKLVENSAQRGIYLLNRLYEIQSNFPNLIRNARGLGLLCSFDFPTKELRDKFRETCEREKLLILGCGTKTIRFRPMLNITDDELEEGLQVIEKVLRIMSSNK
jgi:L-lysine 6-transaminase